MLALINKPVVAYYNSISRESAEERGIHGVTAAIYCTLLYVYYGIELLIINRNLEKYEVAYFVVVLCYLIYFYLSVNFLPYLLFVIYD